MTTDYEKQAQGFLDKVNCKIKVKFLRHGMHFTEDKRERDIYRITLSTGERGVDYKGYSFNFGQSEVDSYPNERKAPTAYDVLACMTKYDPGTFENFCDDFGYDTDSRRAEKTYRAVLDEFKNIQTLFNDSELEEMAEIS